MSIYAAGRTMVVYGTDGVAHFIGLLSVTELEAKPTSNGARRRKR